MIRLQLEPLCGTSHTFTSPGRTTGDPSSELTCYSRPGDRNTPVTPDALFSANRRIFQSTVTDNPRTVTGWRRDGFSLHRMSGRHAMPVHSRKGQLWPQLPTEHLKTKGNRPSAGKVQLSGCYKQLKSSSVSVLKGLFCQTLGSTVSRRYTEKCS